MSKPSKKTYRTLKLSDVDALERCLPKEAANEGKRQLRKPLLRAFDSHKGSVVYGDKTETAEEHAEVMEWKQKALDLEAEAFKNVPSSVEYFLEK